MAALGLRCPMFQEITISSEKELISLTNNVKNELDNCKVTFKYPESLKSQSGQETWSTEYKIIDEINSEVLDSISKKAGVYAIYTKTSHQEPKLKYIGQTDAKGSRSRIRSHLVWRNKNTDSGKYTGSKFDDVASSVTAGFEIQISFCSISPASLRHYVEENLFKYVIDGWNKHGM